MTLALDGYELGGVIHASRRSVVTRAQTPDGRPVILKLPAPELSPDDYIARFRNERAIYERITSEHTLSLRAFVEQPGVVALVFDDPGYCALPEHAEARGLSVSDSLRVALGLLEALACLHTNNIIHRDLKPDNVLLDATLERVMLIDFGNATIVHLPGMAQTRLEGTAQFMAPELTGRVNRPVDYRSDYYCLGATLYWMLCGEAPFGAGETSQLVHAHIARVPIRLDQRNSKIPVPLASIVAKLLAKSARDRYQGAFGLRRDLIRCLTELEQTGGVSPFEIAALDPSEQLRLPPVLIGRDNQREQLAAAHASAKHQSTLALLSGPSGCGKAALIQDLREQLDTRSEHFVEVELAPDNSEALAAVGGTLRTLLQRYERSDSLRERVRERLRAALSVTGAALFEFIPELAPILAQAPALPKTDLAGARTRLWDSLAHLCDALLLPDHAYVISMLGMQWADEADLELVAGLLAADRPVLVVATMHEVEDDPVSLRLREAAAKAHAEFVALAVPPLDAWQVREWLSQLLQDTPTDFDPDAFSALLYTRTRGIPQLLGQFLVSLHDDGILNMDRATGHWSADLERAHAQQSSDDIAGFLAARIDSLSLPALRIVAYAALLGPHFESSTVACACERPLDEVALVLGEALTSGFLVTVGEAATRYRFSHARVREAALQEARRSDPSMQGAHLHLQIVRRLQPVLGSHDELLPTLATHIGHAIARVRPAERPVYALLCQRAAQRASAAAQFSTAADQHTHAAALHDPGSRERFDSLLALAECAGMIGELERAREAYAQARTQDSSRLASARVIESQVRMALFPGHIDAALAHLAEINSLFGLDLRRGESAQWAEALLSELLEQLSNRDPASIIAGPSLVEPDLRALLTLLHTLTAPAYMSGDFNLATAVIVAGIHVSLEHGCSDFSAATFMQLAMLLITGPRDFEAARRYAEISFALFERFPATPLRAWTVMAHSATVLPWIDALSEHLEPLELAFDELRAAGMYTGAGYAANTRSIHSLLIGVPLPTTRERVQTTRNYLRAFGSESARCRVEFTLETCRALMDVRRQDFELLASGAERPPPTALNPTDAFYVHGCRAFVFWVLQQDEGLATALDDLLPFSSAGSGVVLSGLVDMFTASLACTHYAAATTEPTEQARLRTLIEASIVRLEQWATSCPATGLPLRELLLGDWAKACGELGPAFTHFDAAADASAAANLTNFEAIANERAGQILLAQGRSKFAIGYFDHARRCYARWGAAAPLQRLEQELQARGDHFVVSRAPATHGTGTGNQRSSETDELLNFDVASIIKMSQAMSTVTRTDQVIDHLLDGSIENAGADRGVLLLPDEGGQLRVVAVRGQGEDPLAGAHNMPLQDASEWLTLSVIEEALVEVEPVVIDDAPVDERCARDPHVVRAAPRSLLALPIRQHEERIGVLYLENRALDGVFSTLDLEVLATLARQAAIALERGALFDALRQREARWRSLVDNAAGQITIVDREHQVLFANRGILDLDLDLLLGLSESKQGKASVSLDQAQAARAAIDHVFDHGGHDSYDTHITTFSGTTRYLTTRVGPIMRGEIIDHVTLISTEHTEQHQLQAQLHQAQKMQAIGTLAGGVAHDFNNLLTVIRGSTELAQLEDDTSEAIDEYLQEVIDATDRATALTRQLLAFSRKSVLKPEELDANVLIRQIGRLLQRLIGEQIDLRLDLCPEVCGVRADPSQLEQVLMNLVVNGRDAMPGGGSLSVRTQHLHVTHVLDGAVSGEFIEPGHYVLVEVEDTGLGIEAAVRERIFEPFFTTKAAGRGTGLGLATVLGIVQQSGGRLGLDSEVGTGTRVRIYLPLVEFEANAAAALDTKLGPALLSPRATILVVEDESAVRRLAVRLLERRGYSLLQAADGVEAMNIARTTGAIDLLLADVIMPGAQGPEVAEQLQALRPELRVLFMSGYTDDAIMCLGVLDGTKAFLHKPFTAKSLVEAVEAVLAQ